MFKNTGNPAAIKPQPVNVQSPQRDKQRVERIGNPANANYLMKILADVMKSIITENASFIT
jgi:hypothetical protein